MERLTQTGSGRLQYRMAFDKREAIDDGYGNVVSGDWEEQFQERVEFIHLRGSEAVMAARLENRGPLLVMVRRNSMTLLIDTDWRARDARDGTEYNIRDVRKETNRQSLTITLESGVAVG